jgi:hypothetical protein
MLPYENFRQEVVLTFARVFVSGLDHAGCQTRLVLMRTVELSLLIDRYADLSWLSALSNLPPRHPSLRYGFQAC